jgi:hypothetical protein
MVGVHPREGGHDKGKSQEIARRDATASTAADHDPAMSYVRCIFSVTIRILDAAFSLPTPWTLLYTLHIGKPTCFNTLIP